MDDTFSATRDVTSDEYRHAAVVLGRSAESLYLSDVSIRLLMQPGRTPQIARYMAAAKLAIKCFGLWDGAYPYRTLTIVDPPSDAPGAEGMEYPTFITAGTQSLFNWWPFNRIREPEEVVVHEYAHQDRYGLVASNEFEEAWLDEGFTVVLDRTRDGAGIRHRQDVGRSAVLQGIRTRSAPSDQFATSCVRPREAAGVDVQPW